MTDRCEINAEGKVTGPLNVTHNDPFPCVNGEQGFIRPAHGVVIHTEDGFEQGTIAWFNNPAAQVSAHFAVGFGGDVHQFGPVGHGWMSWAQADGNPHWYGIEDADNTHPSIPFTDAQIHSIALLVEVLARHDGFPIAAAIDPFTQRGVTLHSEGGVAFGGHFECPGTVRGAQRPAILEAARALRHQHSFRTITADGKTTLAAYAAQYKTGPSTILRMTAEHGSAAPEFTGPVTGFVDGVFTASTEAVPAGTVLIVPATG